MCKMLDGKLEPVTSFSQGKKPENYRVLLCSSPATFRDTVRSQTIKGLNAQDQSKKIQM